MMSMKTNPSRVAVSALALAFGLSAAAAQAATICVNPNKAGCQPTIQAGVAAALPGDTVKIAKGVYFENVVVNNQDIAITGGKSAILDPTAGGCTVGGFCFDDGDCGGGADLCDSPPPQLGNGFTINAVDVELRGFTIRNGQAHAIETNATGTTVNKMRIVGPSEACVKDNSGVNSQLIVQNSSFFAAGDTCIDSNGGTVLVFKNSFDGNSGDNIVINGDNAIVDNNKVTGGDKGTLIV